MTQDHVSVGVAPGKAILLGEHAVVYGQPAIAVPVTQVRAEATVEDATSGEGVTLVACDLGCTFRPLRHAHPARAEAALACTLRSTLSHLGISGEPDLRIALSSTVPIARGLGSGAAVATALVRALAGHLGATLSAQEVSDLVYETELLHHGTPSGIDNTVIAFARPIFFVKGKPIETFSAGRPFWLLIGDTGVHSTTREVVAGVRTRWLAERAAYDGHFAAIGSLVIHARAAIQDGGIALLGRLMTDDQEELRAIGVSSPALERLIAAALAAGALGAKLAGSGGGGNMIALTSEDQREPVAAALRAAGAARVIETQVA
jgi:mevalonate kinase